jgi:hypothetical protein
MVYGMVFGNGYGWCLIVQQREVLDGNDILFDVSHGTEHMRPLMLAKGDTLLSGYAVMDNY